jgi:hypothetical protein
MAGLKKSSKKDPSSPNMVLLIALILFILVSIGLGVFAYYGYDGQESLRNAAKSAKSAEEAMKKSRDAYLLLGYEAMMAQGLDLAPEQKNAYNLIKGQFISSPDAFADVKPVLDVMFVENDSRFKFNKDETKYESSYKASIDKANEDAKKSKAMLDTVQKEYADFKTNYETLAAKYEKDIKAINDEIKKGNADALTAAQKTNTKFPELQKLLQQREADIKGLSEKFESDLNDANSRIARLNNEIGDLQKKLNDRALGLAIGPAGGGGSGEVHALMLDISRGLPLWDRPLGKITRVDPSNLTVTFNVFASGPGGKADKQLKGTIEVIRVINEASSLARITSLYDEQGQSIPLQSESLRIQAVRAADNILREGDLIFNPFFDAHVFIAGTVNFTGDRADTPSAQNMQLQDFIRQLRKQHIVVDGYINPLNGQIEGNLTPKTRVLVRGEILPANSREEERIRVKAMADAFQVVKKQAIEHGLFIVSAENLAVMIGYRPFMTANDRGLRFQPSLPWTGGPPIRRFDPGTQIGAPAVPAAPMPMPEMEKDEKKE